MKKLIVLLISFSLMLPVMPALAQSTGYVSDVVRVPVRSGAGTQFRILHAGLPSGTRFQIVETEGDWTHIITDGGLDGWMPTQYVTTEPTASIQLDQVERRLAQTRQENSTLTEQVNELRQENQELQQQVETLAQSSEQATEDLAELRTLSADTIGLNNRHRELLEQHEILQTTVDTLRAENDRLESDSTVNKWLYGAGLVILGVLLSIIIPALKPRKRFSDWA